MTGRPVITPGTGLPWVIAGAIDAGLLAAAGVLNIASAGMQQLLDRRRGDRQHRIRRWLAAQYDRAEIGDLGE